MHPDQVAYFHFTAPQRVDKAVQSLEGILLGIAADGIIHKHEIELLHAWLSEHQDLVNRPVFDELALHVRQTLEDSVIDPEEAKDLLWLCARYREGNEYFDAITADIQRLHGMVFGIGSDGKISEQELRGLSGWIEEHEHLQTYWPYDEIGSLITSVLSDGVIDPQEHQELLAFFGEFGNFSEHRALSDQMQSVLNDAKTPVKGLCAVCPVIEFDGRVFCFTGSSKKATRKQFAARVESLGGQFCNSVSLKTNYLVIGGEGNSAWAYSCYGRKVEEAMKIRRTGGTVLLVHEFDFWDAVADRP